MPYYPPAGSSSFDPASPGAIGGTTPAAGTFTSLTATTGGVNITAGGITVTAGDAVWPATAVMRWNGRARFSSGGQDGTLSVENNATTTGFYLSAPTSAATPTVQLGLPNSSTPAAQTLRAQGSRSGTDSNVSGGNLTIQSGPSTGNAAPSALILQSPVPTSSGSGAQTMTTGLTITYGTAKMASYTVSALPAAASAGAGARAFVTDASTPTFGSTVTGGGSTVAPVYSDGTNWKVG